MDTPGHEAFSKMRTRGATVADIAILVVAADDGGPASNDRGSNTIKEANLPYIVATKQNGQAKADPEKIKTQLAESGIYAGKDTAEISLGAKISAKREKAPPELLLRWLLF